MNDIVVSIIIPVYNAEKYLCRCIDSVLHAMTNTMEIILIDDGSIDNSSKIIYQYASKYEKIKAVHQLNGGVSKARNTGIEKASGKWIFFLDSDDWVEQNYLLNFINNSETYDLVIQGFSIDNLITRKTDIVRFKASQNLKNYEVVEMLQYKNNAHNGYLWHRLFKRSIIIKNNIRFIEGCNFAEDGVFFLQYMRYVTKTNVLETIGHHYVVHDFSLTNRKYSNEFYFTIADRYHKTLSEICGDTKYKNFCQNYIWQLIFYWIICRSLHAEDKQLAGSMDSVICFLGLRDVKKPFMPICVFKFISTTVPSLVEQQLLVLFVLIEKKRINISKYLKSVVAE